MNILIGWLIPVKVIGLWLDSIAFSLMDNIYNMFMVIAENEIIGSDAVKALMNNIYVLVGVIALFRMAMLLVNSLIDPNKLYDKKSGAGNILLRVCLMLVALVFSPLIFDELGELQKTIVSENIIIKTIIGGNGGTDIEAGNGVTRNGSKYLVNAGKTMQKIVITALIKPEDQFFTDGEEGVQEYLNFRNPVTSTGSNKGCKANKNGSAKEDPDCAEFLESGGTGENYVNDKCGKNCKRAMAQYHQLINETGKGGFRLSALTGYIAGSAEIEEEGSNGNSYDVYYYEYYAGVTTLTAVYLTYVLLSWSIDIAIRSIELAVLRIISPLFIATIVDPKSTASGGYFNNWLKRYGKTYGDLFIKLAIIAFAILAISLVQDADIWRTVTGG